MKRELLIIIGMMLVTSTIIAGCGEKASLKSDSMLETFDSIIGSLEPGQAYAFAEIDADNDVLLITNGTYDNRDGNMAAIDAIIYGYGADQKIMEYGQVMSEGTAYPLAQKDGYIYFGGGHHVGKEYIDESVSSIITKEDASETFDNNGKATYYYFSLDPKYEGEVADDTNLFRLFDEYSKATIINFTIVE